jgi:hypothetical protein
MPKHEYKCGCTIYWTPLGPPWIEFCPLHEAAEDLLEAVKKLVAYYGSDNSEAIDAGVKAIAKAEGRQA